jgi:hypothetical protein
VFLCLLSTDGSPVADVERTRYAARVRALAKASAVESDDVEVVDAGEFVAFTAPALVPLRPGWWASAMSGSTTATKSGDGVVPLTQAAPTSS